MQSATTPPGRCVALIVGIDGYQHGVPPLRNAVADALALARLLRDLHGYEVMTLTCRQGSATLAGLRQALTALASLTLQDRVLFYFAGHGVVEDAPEGDQQDAGLRGYFLPQDARAADPASFLPMSEVYGALLALPPRHILAVLDCCFAGAFRWVRERKVATPRRTLYRERYQRYVREPAFQVITSAAHDEAALDVVAGRVLGARGQAGEHSPFAQALLEGLRGAADFPAGASGGDGVITASELHLYLEAAIAHLEQETGRPQQTPLLFTLRPRHKGQYVFHVPGRQPDLPSALQLREENNPYRGLRPYEESDQHLFFGRAQVTEELIGRVTSLAPHIVIVGPSGAGKSSLVRAGVLPRLRGPDWLILGPLRPGRAPFAGLQTAISPLWQTAPADLAAVLRDDPARLPQLLASGAAAHPQRQPLLVVDQMEELVTLCPEEAERIAFLRLLQAAPAAGLHVLVTVRADFEPHFIASPLGLAWSTGRFWLRPMIRPELRQAIEEPAAEAVLSFEPAELIERLLDEVVEMPGALPLLSFTLSEMYRAYLRSGRDDRTLSAADYHSLGEVVGALSQRAEEIYQSLDGPHQATMRRVMLRMVALEGDLARRRVPQVELSYGDPGEDVRVIRVVERLADARLAVGGVEANSDAYVEPAHDALIRGWGRLLGWITEVREDLLLQRLTAAAAREWLRHDRARGFLWTNNPRLPLLKQVQPGWLNRQEAEFVRESARRRRQNQRRLFGAIGVTMALLGTAAVVARAGQLQAQRARDRANEQARVSLSRQLSAQALRHSHEQLDLALLLSAHAHRTHEDPEARKSLYGALLQSPYLSRFLHGHTGPIHALAFSPDGRHLASAGGDGTVRLWGMTGNGGPLAPLRGHDGEVVSVAFLPDGERLVSAGKDGTLRFWRLATLAQDGEPIKSHPAGQSARLAVHPKGRILASASDDGTLRLWDLAARTELATLKSGCHRAVRFSPDGGLIACLGLDGVTLVDLVAQRVLSPPLVVPLPPEERKKALATSPRTEAQVRHLRDQLGTPGYESEDARQAGDLLGLFSPTKPTLYDLFDLQFSPNGEQIATVGRHGRVSIFELKDRSLGHTLLPGNLCLTVNPSDDLPLIITCAGAEVRLWNIHDTQPSSEPLGGTGTSVRVLALSPDGRMLAGGHAGDPRITLWDLRDHPAVGQPLTGHKADISALCLAKGNVVASGAKDGSVMFWDVEKRAPRGPAVAGDAAMVLDLACVPDADIVASTDGGRVRLWQASTGRPAARQIPEMIWGLNHLSLSPDGRLLAGALQGMEMVRPILPMWGKQGLVVWDLVAHVPVRLPGPVPAALVRFSPDGKLLAAANKQVVLLDVATWRPVAPPLEPTRVHLSDLAFSPDGRQLFVSGWNGAAEDIQIFAVPGGQRLGIPWTGLDDAPSSLSFSPDGTILLTSTGGEQTRFWDLATRQPLGAPLPGLLSAFTQGGRTLVLARDKTVQFRDALLTDLWVRACRRANRNLSISEWAQFIGAGRPYCRTCPELPPGEGAPAGARACP